jgi:hypothetical protein
LFHLVAAQIQATFSEKEEEEEEEEEKENKYEVVMCIYL